MKYSTKDYEKFLLTEIDSQVKEYEDLVNTRALVLKARGEVFVGRFMKLHDNGSAIFKVRNSAGLPRKGSFWTASYINGNLASFKNWGELSWLELRKNNQRVFSECSCQWVDKAEDDDFCLVGIKGLSLDFIKILEEEKPIISFGPKDPPLEYLYNLLDIVRHTSDSDAKSVLNYSETGLGWHPELIAYDANLTDKLKQKLSTFDVVVVQGPPGTGKTYRMAALASKLMSNGHSVLVTALTNQALMELAKKEDLSEWIKNGHVTKTSLTVDEQRSLPGLLPVPKNECNSRKGFLTLASFYVSSRWAKDANDKPFDYVIMDEASQALLPMIAATRILGRKVVLIGDQKQLPPIVITNEDIVARNSWDEMICGFRTVCNHFSYPAMMLRDTFRLTDRAAQYTGIFYEGLLHSTSPIASVPSTNPIIEKTGGPVLATVGMERSSKADRASVAAIVKLVDDLRKENPKAEIAVLSKFKDSVREIVRGFISQSRIGINDHLRIDTVDKVQGLTVDYCIYFIPKSSIRYSLYEDLFNVATSRAVFNTIIVGDNNLMSENMPQNIRKYMSGLSAIKL